MSSDESTSTQMSTAPSIEAADKSKRPKTEEWEMNLIGNFLLTLYHRNKIEPSNDWLCKKTDIRGEFQSFASREILQRLKNDVGTDNIGSLLHRCRFLYNTPRGSLYYKLRSKELFEFRKKKKIELDRRRLNDDIDSTSTADLDDILSNLVENKNLPSIQTNYEIDQESPVNILQYEGTTMKPRNDNFQPSNMSCYICQASFSTMDSYEEHIQMHNDETDFEFSKQLSSFEKPIFTLSYRLCKDSHHFGFTIETETDDLIIEKIIIVQSRSMFYVHNMRVPYAMPENKCEHFYVDSHLFTVFVEQPIILISHLANHKDTRIIEEHHFMRSEEFPKVNMITKPSQLTSKKPFKAVFKLLDYFPPIEIRNALNDDFVYEKLMKTSTEFREYIQNGKILQPRTIAQTLNTLLHIEDMDAMKEYMKLTQYNVKLRCFGDIYNINLRTKERRYIENILTTFDEIILTTRKDIKPHSENLMKLLLQHKDDMDGSNTYLGLIEDVNSGRVSFKCYRKLDLKRTYTAVFRPSRSQLRLQYRAMEILPTVMPYLEKFLFPSRLLPKELPTVSLELYNKSIANNPEQLQAVQNIAMGPRNDATYIIFGPPGTGKTSTLVEAILQVLKRSTETKILVTASSNSACDEIALRLCKILSKIDMARSIVRIYAQSNEARMETIDDLLLEHSNMYSVHFYPDVEILHEYRIVVCTMSVVGKLALGKFGRAENGGIKYTHLFIDEVAASSEVETLIPITAILTPKSSLIISGDHKQLGAIVKSKRAEEFKLGHSLMERLLERECYHVNTDTGNYDRTIQTRLRLNFRSHPEIVNLYSGLYYNHSLEAAAKFDDVSLVNYWHMAPNKDFPIIFESINGKTYTDSNSYSSYNFDEIDIVMEYVKDLMYFGINGKKINESDIGIISPYKKQYMRIREELNLRKFYGIETGSVENFQGKEKNIIIVSFVRSKTETLGFLENPRRLNVTLSRAKSLLILIGNAKTLSMNPEYEYIIKECQRRKTFISRPDPRALYWSKINNNTNSEQISEKPMGNKQMNKDGDVDTLEMVNNSLKDLKLRTKESNTNVKKEKVRSRRYGRYKKDIRRVNNIENKDDGDTKKVASAEPDISKPMKKNTSSSYNNNINKQKGHKNELTSDEDDKSEEDNSSDNDDSEEEDSSDSDDSDEDDSDDSEDSEEKNRDDKSISKSSHKSNRSQPMKKKNQLKGISKKSAVKERNLDDFFNELPSVPNPKKSDTSKDKENPQINTMSNHNNASIPRMPLPMPNPQFYMPPPSGFPQNNGLPQMRPPPSYNNNAPIPHNGQPQMRPPPSYNNNAPIPLMSLPMQNPQSFMPPNASRFAPPNNGYNNMPYNQPNNYQQFNNNGFQQQFNHHQHFRPNLVGPPNNPHIRPNMQQHFEQIHWQNQHAQQQNSASSQQKQKAAMPNNAETKKNRDGNKNKKSSKLARGSQVEKPHKECKDLEDGEGVEIKNKHSTSGEKVHLAHSMKKKKQKQNDAKVSKALVKSIADDQNNKNPNEAIEEKVKPLTTKISSRQKKSTTVGNADKKEIPKENVIKKNETDGQHVANVVNDMKTSVTTNRKQNMKTNSNDLEAQFKQMAGLKTLQANATSLVEIGNLRKGNPNINVGITTTKTTTNNQMSMMPSTSKATLSMEQQFEQLKSKNGQQRKDGSKVDVATRFATSSLSQPKAFDAISLQNTSSTNSSSTTNILSTSVMSPTSTIKEHTGNVIEIGQGSEATRYNPPIAKPSMPITSSNQPAAVNTTGGTTMSGRNIETVPGTSANMSSQTSHQSTTIYPTLTLPSTTGLSINTRPTASYNQPHRPIRNPSYRFEEKKKDSCVIA
ncbi:uncharacterized protein LOC142241985 [Haematobia irritans]|uniref:uncharacterized protein LOC142241985 n=1 Tax=Haematobia irritans TaxID=7368 RepID=UPI003F50A655